MKFNKPPKATLPNKIDENSLIALAVAEEGTVLLKNDYNALPFKKSDRVAGFGAGQDTAQIFGGGGSGWVNSSGLISYRQGLENAAKDGKIASYSAASVAEAKSGAHDKALYFITRSATEGEDLKEEAFYLYESEKNDILALINCYGKEKIAVILNVGAVVDTSWLLERGVAAIVLAYYGGEQAGAALANILCGTVNPSGKTVDTWAKSYADYPSSDKSGIGTFAGDKNTFYTEDVYVGYRYFSTFDAEYGRVNYEFGYGLSYTEFKLSDFKCRYKDGEFELSVKVTNVGKRAGKEVVQAYVGAPAGISGAPAVSLAGFAKTGLLACGASQTVKIKFDKNALSRFDDTGRIKAHSWVIEAGNYGIYAGVSVKNAVKGGAFYTFTAQNTEVIQTVYPLRKTTLKNRLLQSGGYENMPLADDADNKKSVFADKNYAATDCASVNPAADTQGKTLERLIAFDDVCADEDLLGEFLSQLSIEELARLSGLDESQTDAKTGVGGVGGMYIDEKYKIPFINTSDGPAGIRYVDKNLYATWFPCMTLLASGWNTELAKRFGGAVAAEAALGNVNCWLAPGVNIHRNPLCGRNFEYFSEDPLVAGLFAAAITEGAQDCGISVCVKHFAANNQETNRFENNSCVSERALREIYLKPFEIAVKTARPHAVMSSYNKINGEYAASSYDLITGALRLDWGFDGVVFSDWGAYMSHVSLLKSGNTFKSFNPQYEELVRAYRQGVLSREDFERNARDTIIFLIRLKSEAFRRL